MSQIEKYNELVNSLMNDCKTVLLKKRMEYATDDIFHNFNTAAALQGITPQQALIGMMDKHVISVHDLVNNHADGQKIDLELWKEKIVDNINYLYILWAMVNIQE